MSRTAAAIVLAGSIAAATNVSGRPAAAGTTRVARIDVTRFHNILVAGFATARSDLIDTNEEMVGLLRSQFRMNSVLRVVDAEAPSLPIERMADAEYWRTIGKDHRETLIVTGAVAFTREFERAPMTAGVPVAFAAPGRERPRFVLEPAFVFIDGATGATLYSRSFREEIAYGFGERVPALSAFFDLMNRMLPRVLHVVVEQASAGERTLLR